MTIRFLYQFIEDGIQMKRILTDYRRL